MGHPRSDTESETKASGRIRAVFFDFDGVLTRDKTGSLTTLRYLGEAAGIAYPRLLICAASPAWMRCSIRSWCRPRSVPTRPAR